MKILHVYAGPFPTVQGTQALVDATCELLSRAGHEVHLLVYAHAPVSAVQSYSIHRVPDRPKVRSTRSGPSLGKLILDLRLAAQVRRLSARLEPDIVHAHHYEALLACWFADPQARRPLVFHCHALLWPELETYFPRALRMPLRLVGRCADRFLPRLSHSTGAVTLHAVHELQQASPGLDVALLTPYVAEPTIAQACVETRRDNLVRAVYVGNLDAYQDLDLLLDGLEMLPPERRCQFEVLIVTDSEATPFRRDLERRGISSFVRVISHGPLGQAHALLRSADIALVPRTTEGGMPIKLVNALAAGVPVLANRRSTAFLQDGVEARLVDIRSKHAVAHALGELISDPALRRSLGRAGKLAADKWFSRIRAERDLEDLYRAALLRAEGTDQ
ncbi:MAG: glycosyltransferase family 4 protein [Myxococcota bacterium]|jgi:glycosyltransferase involved in cell wall biosynthesis|nr:glycosyltransferase family 4 protein [Myxococcota bacterium]